METRRHTDETDRDFTKGTTVGGPPVDGHDGGVEFEEEGDLWNGVIFLWDSKGLVVAGTLMCALVAFGISLAMPKQYRSALATVFVAPPTFSSQLRPPVLAVEAYEQLAGSDFVRNKTVERLRGEGRPPVSDRVSIKVH